MNGVTTPFDKLRANGDKLTGQYWGGIFRRICLINYGLLSNWTLSIGQWSLINEDQIGGTCLNRGCIPTKSLLSDAKMFRSLKSSPVFQSLIPEEFNPL